MKIYKTIPYVLFILTAMSTAFGDPVFDSWSCNPYAIIQLGNPPSGDDTLDITSNSSVFGSTLKGKDTGDFDTKLSTSKVTGGWDVETGVDRDISSSSTGSQNEISASLMSQYRNAATDASTFWAGESATTLSASQHSAMDGGGGLTLTRTTGGANVYNSSQGFKVTSGTLTLDGGVGDFFVFNIAAGHEFDVSSAKIKLLGDITPEEVLFNVLGSVGGGGQDDAKIQSSLFMGTLLAPGRNVLVGSGNHFDTFASGGSSQPPLTTSMNWWDATGGLFGQVVAGGKITWTESDIAHHGFCVPEPSLGLLLGISLIGLVGAGAVRRFKQNKVTGS